MHSQLDLQIFGSGNWTRTSDIRINKGGKSFFCIVLQYSTRHFLLDFFCKTYHNDRQRGGENEKMWS